MIACPIYRNLDITLISIVIIIHLLVLGKGWFVPDHIPFDFVHLIGAIIVAKVLTLYGLKQKNFLAK